MEILNLQQGSEEWLKAREHPMRPASEAPIITGKSPYKTRAALLREKATGSKPDVDAATQRRFDAGHATEDAARQIVEEMLGEELYPVTCVDGLYLASLDGLTMDQSTIYEHKLWNEDVAASVRGGRVPDTHVDQLEHQLLVSGAERVLFVVSDGTAEKMVQCEYRTDPARRAALIAAWEQFDRDLAEYRHTEHPDEIKVAAPESLPALVIDIAGDVRASNLATFQDAAIARIEAISTDLQTDEDFAAAESTVTFLQKAEKEIESAKARALAQTEDIDALFRAVDHLKETMRAKRLELDKLVKARKVSIRSEIIDQAKSVIAEHLRGLNATIPRAPIAFDPTKALQDAARNKRSLKGLRDAMDQAIADAKIETSAIAFSVLGNLKSFDGIHDGHTALFPDLNRLAHMDAEGFRGIVLSRIAEAKAEEERRAEAKRIADEVRAKAEAERQEERRIAAEAWARADAERAANDALAELERNEAMRLLSEAKARTETAGKEAKPKDAETKLAEPEFDVVLVGKLDSQSVSIAIKPDRIPTVSIENGKVRIRVGGDSHMISLDEAKVIFFDLKSAIGA